MARLHTGYIDENECMGDTLGPVIDGTAGFINTNFWNLDNAVQNLSAETTAANTTLTNQLITQNTNLVSLSSQVYAAPTSTASNTVLRAYCHVFSTENGRTGNLQNYTPAAGGVITVTSTRPNSRFIVTVNGAGYTTPGSTGANLGISQTIGGVTTRLLGIDGANGDSWMGTSNGYSGSFNITRTALDTPNQPAGTVITYTMLHGHWNAGSSFINYSQGVFQGFSSITVYEIV